MNGSIVNAVISTSSIPNTVKLVNANEIVAMIDEDGILHIRGVANDENARKFLRILSQYVPITGISIEPPSEVNDE